MKPHVAATIRDTLVMVLLAPWLVTAATCLAVYFVNQPVVTMGLALKLIGRFYLVMLGMSPMFYMAFLRRNARKFNKRETI